MVRTDCHAFDPLFSPPTSAPNPCFYQKLSPKVLFFLHCPEFWKFFTQRPLIGWNLRKRYPNVPYFYGFCHWKTPIFCLAYTWFVWGECCSLKHGQKLENFVFSKQNRAIWWILSGANLIKVMKIKFQFYRLNWPNCALSGWISLEGRDDIQAIITLVKHGRGYILQPPSINLHTWLSKQMPSVPEDVRAEVF